MLDKTILIVEDDIITSKLIEITLRNHCEVVLFAQNSQQALRQIAEHTIDAMIMNLHLPDMHSLDILSFVRVHPLYSDIPIVVLTDNCDVEEVITVLEAGADDCIKKPFHNRELIARLNVAFRRINGFQDSTLNILNDNKLVIDPKSRQVFYNKERLPLTFKEYEILAFLYANRGKIFTRDELMTKIWREQYIVESRTIDMHMATLRKKLTKHCDKHVHIETIRGVGYRFTKD